MQSGISLSRAKSIWGTSGIQFVHPFLRRNNWRAKNLCLCGNFNLTNVSEVFEDIASKGQHPRVISDTYILLEQLGHRLDRESERLFQIAYEKGLEGTDITHFIEQHIEVNNILRTAAPSWDGGYVICGMTGRFVSPGFINIHIHGCFGADTMDKKPEAMKTMCQKLPSMGVTSFLPTTITASMEDIQAALERVREHMRNPWLAGGAEVLGANMEGPFISPAYKGSHSDKHVKKAYFSAVEPFTDVVKYITLAPEMLEGDYKFVDKCREAGIILSLGHSGAVYEEAVDAFQRGVTHATHLYNAMSPLHHREPGVVGAVLDEDFTAELIADDVHCHPAAQRLALRLKGDRFLPCLRHGRLHIGAGGTADLCRGRPGYPVRRHNCRQCSPHE